MLSTSRSTALLTAGALCLGLACAPQARAQSSLSSMSSMSSMNSTPSHPADTSPAVQPGPAEPVLMPGDLIVRIMGDVLGPGISDLVGFRSGDLGVMAPLGDGTFALVFGDSFTETGLRGTWMSPVGVVAKLVDGVINIIRPLNAGDHVEQLIGYLRPRGDDNLTLIPSDIINVNGTLYMQGMWNRGIGNVSHTEVWKSTTGGRSWTSVGTAPTNYLGGMGDLISWEAGPDGWFYAVSSSFKRADPVYLSRFRLADIGNRSKWEVFDPTTGTWGRSGRPILATNVRAGEMNLRFIDGHWVLVMFNEATLQIEVRVSDTLAADWNNVPVAVVARNGAWSNPQTPLNFSQPYGGYVVPGSTLANMDLVISQWNTADNSRYNATQFNVKGLDAFFSIDPSGQSVRVDEVPPTAVPAQAAEDSLLRSENP